MFLAEDIILDWFLVWNTCCTIWCGGELEKINQVVRSFDLTPGRMTGRSIKGEKKGGELHAKLS